MPLSPTLANIYLYDIHDQLPIGDIKLNTTHISIAWADDLVFFCLSPNGLKKQLINLEEYSKKWRLNVNIEKTK